MKVKRSVGAWKRVNWRFFWWMFSLLLLFIAAIFVEWKEQTTFAKEENFVESCEFVSYRVKNGDTLWSIASWAMDREYMDKNLDIRENIYYIELKNPYITKCLVVDDVLKIPITNLKGGAKHVNN